MALAAIALQPPPAHAEPVVDYGGLTPCSTWLSNPAAMRPGVAWIMGAWSGLNMQGGMKRETFDIGHTLRSQDVAALVQTICVRDPAKPMTAAILEAYAATKAARR